MIWVMCEEYAVVMATADTSIMTKAKEGAIDLGGLFAVAFLAQSLDTATPSGRTMIRERVIAGT